MSVLNFIVFSEIMESTRGDSSGGGNKGCGCIVILAAMALFLFSVRKCGGHNNTQNVKREESKATSLYDVHHEEIKTVNDSVKEIVPVIHSTESERFSPPPRFNATTIEEARNEGLEYGYDDGEEDGMNNDEDDSYDDSCPYSGRMKKTYQEAYREAYECGWEDGLDIYNSDRDPGEEEADW